MRAFFDRERVNVIAIDRNRTDLMSQLESNENQVAPKLGMGTSDPNNIFQ